MIYLDTHVVAWLFAGRVDLIPAGARALIDGNDLLISPIVALELEYLFEVKKTLRPAGEVIDAMQQRIGLRFCDLPFTDVIRSALKENWTTDPFDRIVVAQARLRGEPLLTKDRNIRRRYREAVWDRTRR